jgi:hypothetical protein
MADFEPDQESVARAATLSSRLMQDLRSVAEDGPLSRMRHKLFSEQRYSEQAEGVPINDVVTHVGKMATEFAMARRWDNEILCLKLDDGEFAPISIGDYFGGSSSLSYGSDNWLELWEREFPFPFPLHRLWREVLRNSPEQEGLIVTSVAEAEERVARSLQRFLSYRFGGMKKWTEWIQGSQLFGGPKGPSGGGGIGGGGTAPPLAVGPGGGLQIQVSCLTPGLRIHVAPAYFISWVFFGSPTTPVSSYVLPGRYVFAGDGPMLPRRKRDHAVFSIPPTYHAALTRF